MKRYKFLNLTRNKIKSASGNEVWKVGKWKHIDGEIVMCERGFHCSKTIYHAFSYVQGEILAEVEVKGKRIIDDDKEVYSDMRINKAWKWTKKDSVALAIYSAELVLKNYEEKYPNDLRPREAIEAAKKVLFKDTKKNRSAARSAAWSAWSAAESAARSAARSAAESARSAARSAAESAESAARSAAESAESAARSAARYAAESAESAARSVARSVARSATNKKIHTWMKNHIKEMEEYK